MTLTYVDMDDIAKAKTGWHRGTEAFGNIAPAAVLYKCRFEVARQDAGSEGA
jgi:hypothetical protein